MQADDQFVFGQHPDALVVAAEEGIGGPGHVRGDQGEQFNDHGIDGIQITLKCLPKLGHTKTYLALHLITMALPGTGI